MIDTDAIRKKVLLLAFAGRLTERQNSDSDVSQIVEKCRNDKQKSIGEGKCKKEAFRDIVETPLYTIPDEWEWMYISDMALFQEGPGILAVDFQKEGVPLIRISGMNGVKVSLCGCNYLDPAKVEEKWNHFRLKEGDILVSSSASLDRVAEVDRVAEGAIPYTGIIRFEMYGGISKEYFKLFIRSPYYIQQVNRQKQGGMISHYGPMHLRKMMIPIPSLEEQIRIVDKLDKILAQIQIIDDLQKQYETNVEVLKKKILDAGIRGLLTEQIPEDGDAETLYAQILEEKEKLVKSGKLKKEKLVLPVSDEEIPFEIPINWKWARIANIGITVTGTTPSKTNPDYYGGEYPFFKPADLDNGRHISVGCEYLSKSGESVSRKMGKGSILVCCVGSIGKAAIIDLDATANQQINALAPIISDSDYILYGIESEFFQNQLSQASRATTVSIISKSKFDECILPLPPLAEQKRIVERINRLLKCVGV